MEKVLGYYRKIIDHLEKALLVLAASILGLDIVSIFLEAVGRYMIGSSRAFMEELPRLLVPFIVFPMMGVLLRMKKHINVDVLPAAIKGKRQSLLLIIVYAVVIAVAIQFLIAGIVSVKYFYQLGFETRTEIVLKLWMIYLPFPLGFGLLILFAVEMLWTELGRLIRLCRNDQDHGKKGKRQ